MPKYIVAQPAIALCVESRSSRSPTTTSAPMSRNACARSSSLRTIARTVLPCFNSSSVSVLRKNVISRLHFRVAREPALGVVRLRRLVSQGAGRERIGRGFILEHGPSPSAAVREPLAILHHEVDVVQASRHRRIGERLVL